MKLKLYIELIVFGLRLKPSDFNRSLHTKVSPRYKAWKNAVDAMAQVMASMGSHMANAIDDIILFDQELNALEGLLSSQINRNCANVIEMECDNYYNYQ